MTNSGGALLDMTRFLPFGGYRGSDPAFLTERAFTGHKANNTSSNDLGLIYMNARYYVGSIGRFASADTLVPDQNDPQALNRYTYARNNPLLIVDPSGHCWSFASGLRNTFYATTCNNLDMAVSIVQHPDASVGEKVVAGAYIVTEGVAHTAVLVGSTVVIVETAPAAIPYAQAAIAKATTTALAHETTTAVLGGIAETAMECSMTGGGCGPADFVAGALTAGAAHRLSTPRGRQPGPTVESRTGEEVGAFIVDPRGNTMIQPVGGNTVPAGRGGVDTHTTYSNGSNYHRLNPMGHPNNPTPHAHGHLLGPGPKPDIRGQGQSIDIFGNIVPWNSADAHWPIKQ